MTLRLLMLPKPEPADAVTSGIGRYVGILERNFGSDIEVFHLPGEPHEEDWPTMPVPVTENNRAFRLSKCIPAGMLLLAGYLRETLALASKLRPYRNQVDLIHVNRVGCEIQTIAARLAGFKRIVATIHNLPGEDEDAQHKVRRMIERFSFGCAHRLISVSEATCEAWVNRIGLDRNKVTVIRNGMDVDEQALPTRQEARRRLGIPEEGIVFGICARLHPMKGHMVLLDAFAILLHELKASAGCGTRSASATQQLSNSTTPPPLLLIAGDGPEQERIENKIRELGLEGCVRMLGRIQDVMGFMRALDIHVLPSITLESMPFSVVEAMFAGVPSIVSDVGGAKEIIMAAEGGQVVLREDVTALAAAMGRWFQDRELRDNAGVRCLSYAKTNLTGRRMTDLTENLYRKVIGA